MEAGDPAALEVRSGGGIGLSPGRHSHRLAFVDDFAITLGSREFTGPISTLPSGQAGVQWRSIQSTLAQEPAVSLKLEIELGPRSHVEELDAQSRRLRRSLLEQGLSAGLAQEAAPLGTKASAGDTFGQLEVDALPEQYAALVGVLGQWASFDPDRAATLRQIPAEQWGLLAGLVVAMLPRLPNRLAHFSYRDGDRLIEFDYDPTRTDPQQLLSEIQAAAQGGVHILAHGDITIGGSVVGRDASGMTQPSY